MTDAVPAPAAMPPPAATLRVVALGFNTTEQRLLDGTVKLSQRRNPKLVLLTAETAEQADAILIDAQDAGAMAWARANPWIGRRTVIWVDGGTPHPGHTMVRRPVQWPGLPILLARAFEQSASAEQRVAAATAPVAAQTHGTRVLVVDDSLAVRNHLRSLLEASRLTVLEAESAEAGIALAAAEPVDCILLDVLMPGIDGYEACRRIKAANRRGSGPSIVMLTSKSSPFDRIRGKMAGCDAYLTKPVDAAELRQTLSRFVQSAPAAPARAAVPTLPTSAAHAPLGHAGHAGHALGGPPLQRIA